MPDIVLVEFQEDVHEAARLAKEDGLAVIAVTAEGMQALDEAGCAYDIWIGGDHQSREDRVAEDNLRRLEPLATTIGAATSALVPKLHAEGFDLTRCWGQQLITFLDALSFRSTGLRRLVSSLSASRVQYFRPAQNDHDGLMWSLGESVWSSLCDGAAAQRWLACEWIGRPSRATRTAVQRRTLHAARSRRARLAGAAAKAMQRAAHVFGNQDRPRARETVPPAYSIVALGGGHELEAALRHLRGMCVTRWTLAPAPEAVNIDDRALRTAADDTFDDIHGAGLLSWDGLDVSAGVRDRWQRWFVSGLPTTAGTFTAARTALQELAPAFVLHSEIGPDAPRRTSLEAAASLRIPRVLMQWGGNYGYMRQAYLAFAELRSDWMTTYTADVAAGLEHGARLGSERLPSMREIGSLYFSETRERWQRRGAVRDIVYVPSGTTGSYRYGPHLCPDDTALFQLERTVVTALATRFPGRVVIKRHPSNRLALDPIESWLRSSGLDARTVNGPLEDVVPDAAVWIIDGLATVLQQVALSGRPIVYLHTGAVAPLKSAEPLLKRAVTWLDATSPDLGAAVDAAVTAALEKGAEPGAAEFFERYVGCRTTEDVAARLNTTLQAIRPDACTLLF